MADALQPGCKTPHWELGPKGRFDSPPLRGRRAKPSQSEATERNTLMRRFQEQCIYLYINNSSLKPTWQKST